MYFNWHFCLGAKLPKGGRKMSRRSIERFCLLCVFLSVISTASATLITGSQGTTYIIGNNPGYANGSFRVQVDYAIYDGKSSTDPKGLTSDYQISLVLTNLLGGAGETPVLTLGRLTVFAPNPQSSTVFYTKPASATNDAYVATSSGTRAPRIVKYHPQNTPALPNCVEFIFDSGTATTPGYQPQFAPGETSKQLILRTPVTNLPARILLEIDSTNAGSYGVDGEVYLNIIPEPCSLVFFGSTFLYTLRRLRK